MKNKTSTAYNRAYPLDSHKSHIYEEVQNLVDQKEENKTIRELAAVKSLVVHYETTFNEWQVFLESNVAKVEKEVRQIQEYLVVSRTKPLQQIFKNVEFMLLATAANLSPIFSEKRRQKFARSAAKRDPKRAEVARLLSYIKDEKARISKNIKPRKLDQDLSAASNGSLRNPNFGSTRAKGAIVDIVVPVYNALTDVQDCLLSILSSGSMLPVRVIVVDDGSDSDTKAWLEDWVREPRESSIKFELIQHVANLGYTKAVNRGLRASNAPFVVTLNSDTIVTKNWLEGMIRCILSNVNIGVCGPLSNAASWQNIPELLNEEGAFAINELPAGLDVQSMSRVVSSVSSHRYPRTPFVNGFCFMIKRAVLDKVGLMDEESFPLGYGEENDFCIRALDEGFDLAFADNVYVFHKKSKSFGAERRIELSKRGNEKIRLKHGGEKFEGLVRTVKNASDMDEIRRHVKKALQAFPSHIDSTEKFSIFNLNILFLLPAKNGGGGVHSVVQEAHEMRLLGLNCHVAVRERDIDDYLRMYEDLPFGEDLFIRIEDKNFEKILSECNIVVSTIFSSVPMLVRLRKAHPRIMAAYYVQDYEPLFFDDFTAEQKDAFESYTLIPDCTLFAKTDWIREQVFVNHGVIVEKVSPSIDHDVYKPASSDSISNVFQISAMIRPQTARRGADRTMELLSRLSSVFGDKVEINIFGCADDELQSHGLHRNFPFTNHGFLTRREVSGVLQKSDFFLDLSDYQAFGRTALEAMACSTAVLVPKFGGTVEYASDRLNAIVADPRDLNECFHRIEELIINPLELEKMKLAGLETAARYTCRRAALSELNVLAQAYMKHRLRLHLLKADYGE